MARLQCSCGNELSNVISPSSYNGWLVSDIQLDSIEGDVDSTYFIREGRDVWECDQCGKIAIGNNKDNKVKWYLPEDRKSGKLFGA